ncbi:ribose import ATP-binding protein RbsA [Acrocarpospora pleiomorpha]|uniref:Ribose import ATP-binding protein RbsA n=1 Tax=Acrocarpospora pleiomorpha TaxID=90975 RepID=A0A5M3X7A9_9ACTN|nr:sugar ABC transporter ATP-binding protein [Acrocarpospora pleiomorpha]GES17567.1 ribose import ATP-binding protein RbsA [Acrocarpospora pleiomorpha]
MLVESSSDEDAGLFKDQVTPALQVHSASKTFGGVRVLEDVSLAVLPGEIRAIVGENGSGKSTLVKILAGYYEPDAGTEVAVAGNPVTTTHAGEAKNAGLRFVHQDLALVDSLNVVENLGLGRGFGCGRGRPVNWADRRREARQNLAELGYDVDVTVPTGKLQASERTAVAVARAVAEHHSRPQLLVLDEPTANLPGPEVERLFDLVRRVRDNGVAVLFISHHLDEVFELADSVTVLRGGRLITTRPIAGLDRSTLIELIVGHPVQSSTQTAVVDERSVVLELKSISGATVHKLSADVRKGEILGIAGITGSGREAAASLIFGGLPRTGDVVVDGHFVPSGRPDLSIGAGIAMVPANRPRVAVVHGHTVAENLTLARLKDFSQKGWLRRREEMRTVQGWLGELDVRPREPHALMSRLSGGNAQKVILARWLRLEPRVLILDEPTQGVDVGAKQDIHDRIRAAASSGCSVVVCSTDSEELALLCTRILVFSGGRVESELPGPVEAAAITAACLAATPEARKTEEAGA